MKVKFTRKLGCFKFRALSTIELKKIFSSRPFCNYAQIKMYKNEIFLLYYMNLKTEMYIP